MSDFYRGEQIWNMVLNDVLDALRVELVNESGSPALVDFPEGSNADQNQDAMIDRLTTIRDRLLNYALDRGNADSDTLRITQSVDDDFSKESKQDDIISNLIDIDSVLDIISIAIAEINSTLDVDLSTRASEATLQSVLDRLENYDRNRGNATSQTLRFTQASDDDFSTGAKQDQISSDINSLETVVSNFNDDYNNQTDQTQTILQSEFDETQSNQLDQTSELQDINSNLDSVETKLDTIESTLEEFDRDSGNVTSETLRVTQSLDVSNYVRGRDVNGTPATENPVRVAGNDYANNAVRAFSVDQFAILKVEKHHNGSQLDYNAGSPTGNTQRVVGPITDKNGNFYEFLSSPSTIALPVKIVGNDGNYQAFVDADGKVSVNANVTFPEVLQFKKPVLNGSNKSMNVNGSGTPVEFSIAPPTGKVWFVQGVSIVIADSGDFDISDLGAIAGISNGLQCEITSKGIVSECFNVMNNLDMYAIFTDASIFSTLPGGLFGSDENVFAGKFQFQNRIALDNNFGDKLSINVRDNLTGLNELYIYVHYWELNG